VIVGVTIGIIILLAIAIAFWLLKRPEEQETTTDLLPEEMIEMSVPTMDSIETDDGVGHVYENPNTQVLTASTIQTDEIFE
jgi:hypothetical protein